MFPVHCNNCFKKRDSAPALQFQLTRCHHIICASCLPNSSDADRRCPVCNRSFHGAAITCDMPSHIANYFSNPNNFLKMYRSISKFQSEQRTLYYSYFYKQQLEVPKLKRKLQAYVKLESHLRSQNENEKRRIAELRNYIDYHERRDKIMVESSLSSSSISTSSHRMRRPRTPSLSGTDTTLTDNDAEMSDADNLIEFEKLLTQASSAKSTKSKHAPTYMDKKKRVVKRNRKF